MTGQLIVLIGLPGSGKTTLAHALSSVCQGPCAVVSSDGVRRELGIDPADRAADALVFQTCHERVEAYLRQGQCVIFDATNIEVDGRLSLLTQMRSLAGQLIGLFLDQPVELCQARNALRSGIEFVPPLVIEQKAALLYRTRHRLAEGFDAFFAVRDDQLSPVQLQQLIAPKPVASLRLQQSSAREADQRSVEVPYGGTARQG